MIAKDVSYTEICQCNDNFKIAFLWTYMDPPESEQVVLVLILEKFFFILGGARVRGPTLLWYYKFGHSKDVIPLQDSVSRVIDTNCQ